jgi:hypothetical protein
MTMHASAAADDVVMSGDGSLPAGSASTQQTPTTGGASPALPSSPQYELPADASVGGGEDDGDGEEISTGGGGSHGGGGGIAVRNEDDADDDNDVDFHVV